MCQACIYGTQPLEEPLGLEKSLAISGAIILLTRSFGESGKTTNINPARTRATKRPLTVSQRSTATGADGICWLNHQRKFASEFARNVGMIVQNNEEDEWCLQYSNGPKWCKRIIIKLVYTTFLIIPPYWVVETLEHPCRIVTTWIRILSLSYYR